MTGKSEAVFGVYPDRPDAEQAVGVLQSAGFRGEDISILLACGLERAGDSTKATAFGGARGALQRLTGAGVLNIPGHGSFGVAGPLVGALAAASSGGGVARALTALNIPQSQAERYQGRIQEGHVLISARCDTADWVRRAKDVLWRTGAQDIASTGEITGYPPKTRAAASIVADEELHGSPRGRSRTRTEAEEEEES